MPGKVKGLVERLADGEHVVVAEGYLFEFERRGYLSAGPYVPQVVLEQPHLVKSLHEEFVYAGSDVTLAFTYYGHREKLRISGMADILEELNRTALRLAREVADETGTLMAGNICNTAAYAPNDDAAIDYVKQCFKEQVEWATEGGADFIVAETFTDYGEAKLALDAIKTYGKGLPAVVTMGPTASAMTGDNMPVQEACRLLEEAGAAVVGLNCFRGPESILPVIKEVKKVCKGPIACLPVTYRTDAEHPTFQALKSTLTGRRAFPLDLDEWRCSRTAIENFTKECMKIGVQYIGLCCGGSAHTLRSLAETLGRKPPGSRFSPNMKLHIHFGDVECTGRQYCLDQGKLIAGE